MPQWGQVTLGNRSFHRGKTWSEWSDIAYEVPLQGAKEGVSGECGPTGQGELFAPVINWEASVEAPGPLALDTTQSEGLGSSQMRGLMEAKDKSEGEQLLWH